MKCKICKAESAPLFRTNVLNKYDIQVYKCSYCGFVFTEYPFWLQEAYRDPINKSDSGILTRNIRLRKVIASILWYQLNPQKTFLDYAGGYGIFTRLMRDIGFDFLWSDPFTQNLFAESFVFMGKEEIEAITAIELFEHLADPIEEVNRLFKISPIIILTTYLVPIPTPDPNEWWYYGFNHGQHISFYSQSSFIRLAELVGANFYTNGLNIHILSLKKLSNLKLSFIFRSYRFLWYLVRLRMKSKTMADMNLIINQKR